MISINFHTIDKLKNITKNKDSSIKNINHDIKKISEITNFVDSEKQYISDFSNYISDFAVFEMSSIALRFNSDPNKKAHFNIILGYATNYKNIESLYEIADLLFHTSCLLNVYRMVVLKNVERSNNDKRI